MYIKMDAVRIPIVIQMSCILDGHAFRIITIFPSVYADEGVTGKLCYNSDHSLNVKFTSMSGQDGGALPYSGPNRTS